MCLSKAFGSSPHTRGALKGSVGKATLEGIIPAYAGSTRMLSPGGVFSADHPRIRGEHHAKAFEAWNVQGSSPHTRGALSVPQRPPALDGIIPAYAGSTDAAAVAIEAPPDHPRIRGEH